MIRLGVIGYSDGNGHPFSFSAIVNGFDDVAFIDTGWPVIHDYLRARSGADFGFPGVTVTHAWTQDPSVTSKLCAACRIEAACAAPDDMLADVDAVLVLRDDWESHLALARPFLEAGKAVFVDKPLSLDAAEMEWFEPYLRNARLMSTSGMRYAAELDPLREAAPSWPVGTPLLVNATVLNGLETYGIHMLEALLGLGAPFDRPIAVTRLFAAHQAFAYSFTDGPLLQLNCLGPAARTFHFSLYGKEGQFHADLHDNFTAFRRTLAAFVRMIEQGDAQIPPDQTVRLMRLIRTSRTLQPGESRKLD